MKIVIDARLMDGSSGVSRYISNLLKHLQRIDTKTQYIVLLNSVSFRGWQPTASNFTKLEANFRHFSLAEQIQFCWFLYRQRANLVHFTASNHPVLYLKRRIVTIHDLTLVDHQVRKGSRLKYFIKYWAFRFVIRHAVYSSEYIITPTNYIRKQLLSRYHVRPLRFITTMESVDPLGTKLRSFATLKNQQYLLYVGTAYPFKNLETLVLGFKSLASRHPQLKLVLVGKHDSFYRNLKKFIKQTGTRNIILTNRVSDAELSWIYQHASMYVFPSLSEGFGLPGLEAMQHGLPLISSNASCLPEVYGNAAYYFDPHQPTELAQAIDRVLADKGLRDSLVAKGSKRLASFSWKRMAQLTHRLYLS